MAITSIEHRERRGERANIERLSSGLYRMESLTTEGRFYTIDLDRESCTCPAHVFSGKPCKHVRLAKVRERRRKIIASIECGACYGGLVFLTYEEDGEEFTEAVPCRQCSGAA